MSNYTARLYRLNDAQLIQESTRLTNAVKRDWSEFAEDADMMSVFKSVVVAQKAMRQSMEKSQGSVRFVMGLELVAEEVRNAVYDLEIEILKSSGVNDALRANRRLERLSNFNDTGLLAVAISISKRVAYGVESGKMSKHGEMALQKLQALTASFETKVKEKVQKQLEHALADEECAHVGNLLFDRLMFLANIGKRRFFMTNWEKYQDYLMPDESNDVARLITLVNSHHGNETGSRASGM